jgi:N utilization substance protein B
MNSTPQGPSRRIARETAFQFLFSRTELTKEASREDFNHFCQSFGVESVDYAWDVVTGVLEKRAELDAVIESHSKNWRLERMPRVDLSILRLAAYEILHRTDIPKTVAINEAIELAKRFGSEGSGAFINGILDKLEKHS